MDRIPASLTRTSKRVVISYILDWIVVIIIAAVGGGFNYVGGNKRPFDLDDATISLPYVEKEKVSTAILVVVGLVAPAIIIFLVSLIFIPGPTVPKSTPRSQAFRRKLWEWHTGWLGLALALAFAFLFTNGSKNLFGKPRPDLLSRCHPNLSNVGQFRVGFRDRLVSWTICQQTDKSILDDGFRSFPSGHSSFSWAGLTYLTLWLCAKFAIAIPFLSPICARKVANLGAAFPEPQQRRVDSSESTTKSPFAGHESGFPSNAQRSRALPPLRNQAASPPAYLLVMVLVPICAAIYISSTRFSDFRHFGFDILFGSIIGALFAWFAFRWTHLPIRQGAGWSWGSRSRDRAFGIGVGVLGYVGDEEWESNHGASRPDDVESKPAMPAQTETNDTGLHNTIEGRVEESTTS